MWDSLLILSWMSWKFQEFYRQFYLYLYIWHCLQNKANKRMSWNAVHVHISIIPTWTNISSCLSYETDVDDNLVKDSQRNEIVLNTCLRFEVFTAVKVHIVVFWVKTSCSLVGGYLGFCVTLPPHSGYIYNIWGFGGTEDSYCVFCVVTVCSPPVRLYSSLIQETIPWM
jgi:hypothetical protein